MSKGVERRGGVAEGGLHQSLYGQAHAGGFHHLSCQCGFSEIAVVHVRAGAHGGLSGLQAASFPGENALNTPPIGSFFMGTAAACRQR